MRRRQLRLLAAAGAAFALGAAVGAAGDGGAGQQQAREPAAPAGGEAPAARGAKQRAAVDGLALEQQVGRLVVLRFAGTTAPEYVRRALREGRVAGTILFRDNVTGPEQVRALTRRLGRGEPVTPLVCLDQEGGEVRILQWAAPERSAPQQAAAGTVRADSRAAGEDLRAMGVNVVLAPVADVPSVPGAALAGRAFATEPAAAAEAVADAVRGFGEGGVAPTVKHFPGLGGATVNTDDGPATVERPEAALREEDLAPFRAAVEAGAPLVMAGHARYPAIDPERIASQSEPVIAGLLRRDLGFRGVVITDSTEAAAVQAVSGVETAALRSIRAGVDVMLTTGRGSYIRVYRALLAEAQRSREFRARVRESAARVLTLQRSL